MRMPRLDARDRRALLLGGVTLGPMLLFALVVRPLARALRSSHERLASERQLLVHELSAVRAVPAARAMTRRGHALLDTAGAALLDGDDALAADAALATYARDVAEQSGLHLQGAESAGSELADVRLEVRADGDLASIVEFLRTLEEGEMLVRVERLGIDRHGPEADATTRGRLALTATLRGYARGWYASTASRGAP